MKRSTASTNVVWLVLVLASGLSFMFAEGRPEHQALGSLLVGLLFALAVLKGWLVIDVFMGLRWAPVFWRSIMLAWLVVICTLLAVIYAVTLRSIS